MAVVAAKVAAEAVTDYMPVRIGLECRVISFAG